MSVGTVILAVALLLLLCVGVIVLRRGGRAGQMPRGMGQPHPVEPGLPRAYSPQNVGNDASARPWERNHSIFGDFDADTVRSTQSQPPGFDVDGFLRTSKDNFVRLQAAWDRADVPTLRTMMTADMVDQLHEQLVEREVQGGKGQGQSEVAMLEAKLLGIEELEREYLASVEFSGVIREDAASGPNPFREVWSITRAKSGAEGWLVAGVQALQ